MTEEVRAALADLETHLANKTATLRALARASTSAPEALRLEHKADGMALALSYVQDRLRQ